MIFKSLTQSPSFLGQWGCNFALALRTQLSIILCARVVHKKVVGGGAMLAVVQTQMSSCGQFWMAYDQFGSNCFQTWRPDWVTDWQLCYVKRFCRACYMLPLQLLNGSCIKAIWLWLAIGNSEEWSEEEADTSRPWPQIYACYLCVLSCTYMHKENNSIFSEFCSILSWTTIASISLCPSDKIMSIDLVN